MFWRACQLAPNERVHHSSVIEGSLATVTGHEATSPAPDLAQYLLDAKVTVPPTRPGAVSRANLISAARSSEFRFVWVTAPAGYGKTTFLAEWAEAEDRRVAWLSLDHLDDDPAVLLYSLASAYDRAGLGSADLIAEMRGPRGSVLGRAAPRLVAEFSASSYPFVLMLDDLQELHSPASEDVLGVVISGIPEGSQLAVASRSEEYHLPRLRARGEALEFGPADLAVDAAGAQQIFSNAQVSISPQQAATVTERTEGWPTGIYLAALIARKTRDQDPAVTGDDRYVADYLYREVLIRQSQELQEFLRRTAVLEQLSGPLCDALLGSSTAAGSLRRLEHCCLFLIPLDRRREWYRYHPLFREFLLGELRQTEPDALRTLHQRAADWYESNGSPELALEHLLHTDDRDRSMRAATALTLPMYGAGQMATSQRWYRAIGDEHIARYPPLAVMRCYEAVLTGDAAGAERWAAIVDAASFDGVPPDGSASFESARAMLRAVMCAKGPEAMMADAAYALSQEPAWSQWRAEALWSLGEANLIAGQPEMARELLAEASAAADTCKPDTLVVCESELALLDMDRGAWNEAAARLERALETTDKWRLDDYVTSLLASAGAARLSVHRGELQEARNELARAMRARPSASAAFPIIAVRLRLQLAKVYASIAEPATARQLLREIDDILLQRPALGTLAEEVEDFRRVLESGDHAGATGRPPLTPAELRLLPYLQTHLTADRIAERLFLSSHTVKTQVKSIYRKLDVASRDDAVQKAKAVGLLGG
jgi:LuxR family transcriptional regulator, maltose regulon positive regulatory protein